MNLRMWTYDIAREQSPNLETLRKLCRMSLDSGYNALGLYLEHRFEYPSIPWVHGIGSLSASDVKTLQSEFHELTLIPLVNLLGHAEGFLYTEEGSGLAEARFEGMQGCPSNPAFIELCKTIIRDTLECFDSPIIHIGGDETAQLGQCPTCKKRVEEAESAGLDGKAEIYRQHFEPLAQMVKDAGRRPAIWADMFFEHPTAIEVFPRETLIFDWQYFRGPENSSKLFVEKGFDVVACPTLHAYNSVWLHLPQSEENARQHIAYAKAANLEGVCLTTWEAGLLGNYETLLPAIKAVGKLIEEIPPQSDMSNAPYEKQEFPGTPEDVVKMVALHDAPTFLKAYLEEGELHEDWARLMGIELQKAGGPFAFSGWRSGIKCRLLLYSNPFLLWLRLRDDLVSEPGVAATSVLERALSVAPNSAYRGVSELSGAAIDFVRHVEASRNWYSKGELGNAIRELAPCRQIFDNLGRIAAGNLARFGGSRSDIERAKVAREAVEKVMVRLKQYGEGSLGYRPSYEMLCHPKFMPHDQAGWWLVNTFANE